MEKIKNLWPTDLANVKITMPKEILIQQGNYIAELTKDLIVAEVKTDQGVLQGTNENVMVHRFVLKAPTMGNYSFNLLRAMHNFSIYPVTVWNGLTEDENIAEFNAKMTAIADKEKAQISEEKDVKDSNFTAGSLLDNTTSVASLVQEQKELPLQIGDYYVDASLPRIIESISYDATIKDYIVNGFPFKKFTLEYIQPQAKQDDLKQKYEASLQTQPVISDEEVLKQLEEQSNLSEPEKPVILEEESELTKLLNSLKVAGISFVKEVEDKLISKGEIVYTKWLNDKGFKIGSDINTIYNNIQTAKSIKSKNPTFNFVEVKPEDVQKISPVILEEENKVDSLFRYLETIGVFPTEKLNSIRAKKGDETTYEALTNDFELFIGKNSNENYIVMSKVIKHSQASIFEIKTPKLRVKEKIR